MQDGGWWRGNGGDCSDGDDDPHLLFHAAVKQCIPAHGQVVDAWALVAEVAVGCPAALRVVLGPGDHVHASIDHPVSLLTDDETLDGRVAEDRDQQAAFTACLVHRMAEVGQIKEGHAEEFKEGVGCGGLAVGEIDRAGDQPPIRPWQAAIGHRAVDDPVVALAVLKQNPA